MSVSLQRLADLLKTIYINENIAKLLYDAVIEFGKSDAYNRFKQTNDFDKLVKDLNNALFAIANDHHLNIAKKTSNSIMVGDGSGLEKNTSNYIKMSKFGFVHNEDVRKEYWDAINKLENYLVLDLRNCPGGDFDLAYFILCHFIPDGIELVEISRRYSDDFTLNSKSDFNYYCSFNTIKKFSGDIKVIVNGNTASAAETVAFVLQNTQRAKIYGSKTQGSNYMTSRWDVDDFIIYIPYAELKNPANHRHFQDTGIVPDFPVNSKEYIELLMNEIVKH
jgi:C-terminal processing protease CtpA/Prc